MSNQDTLNASTTYKVGDLVIVTEGCGVHSGRAAVVIEASQQHSTNGYRRVILSLLRVEGMRPRYDGVCLPNEYVKPMTEG